MGKSGLGGGGRRRDLFPRKSPHSGKSKSDSRVHMGAGDMPDGVNHHRHNEPTGHRRSKLRYLSLITHTQCRRSTSDKHKQIRRNHLRHKLTVDKIHRSETNRLKSNKNRTLKNNPYLSWELGRAELLKSVAEEGLVGIGVIGSDGDEGFFMGGAPITSRHFFVFLGYGNKGSDSWKIWWRKWNIFIGTILIGIVSCIYGPIHKMYLLNVISLVSFSKINFFFFFFLVKT